MMEIQGSSKQPQIAGPHSVEYRFCGNRTFYKGTDKMDT